MQKIFFFLIILSFPLFLFSQQKATKIKIVSFSKISYETKKKVSYLRNPVFQQDNATLTCDSAVFFSERNYFEAFKNVHINQLTTDIYSDQLEYDGNKKHAHLTGNVRMTDPTSVLTTNILDYNTLSKIGTYTSGGKIVNQEVTLTSKNGYYFSTSNDAYFRYDVVVVTPQVTIKSDTLRYNTQTKWTYFYGPTNIKGKDDNLYTENGAYNTASEDAYFGKKNLYTQGTRSLKGDSLYYFGKIGYGKAVRNIVFSDTKDKMKMFGNLGYYYKKDQRTLVTKNAYLGIGTEDSVLVNNKKRPDSLWMGADTLETQMVLQKKLQLIPKISIKADNEIGEDEDEGSKEPKEIPGKPSALPKKPDVEVEASKPKNGKDKSGDPETDSKNKAKNPNQATVNGIDSLSKQIADSTSTVLKNKADSVLIKNQNKKIDSLTKKTIEKGNQILKNTAPLKGLPKELNTAKDSVGKTLKGIKPIVKKDSVKFNPADTLQARIIKAYHKVKIFKSNIQAKTDSLFYTSADSTLRCFVNPIIWSEGSQQIADTIYVQFKNQKLNNLQAIRNAFLVNTPKDSLRFNQIKGRLMTGFFNKGKLKTMYVDGNAESIYYTQDDSTKVYKEMNQTLSSRIKFIFQDTTNDIQDIVYIKGVEGVLNPENKVAKDNVLKGFSWKPNERPKSKKDAVGSAGTTKQKVKAKAATNKSAVIAKKTVPVKATNPKINPTKDNINLNINKNVPPANPLDTVNFGIKPILPKVDTSKRDIKKL